MTPDQIAVALAVDLALLATVAGLFKRGRWRLCVGFVFYVTVVVASNLAVVTWPDRFFTASFWTMTHGTFEVARLWIGLEIAYRSFNRRSGASPAARRTAVIVVGLVTLVTAAARLDESARLFAAGSSSHVLSGSLGVILGTLAVARAYRVTLHPFHATLLRSFAAYLVVFELQLRLAFAYGFPAHRYLASLEPFGYFGLACWWTYAAWRRQSSPMPPLPGRLPVAAASPDRPARRGGLSPASRGAPA